MHSRIGTLLDTETFRTIDSLRQHEHRMAPERRTSPSIHFVWRCENAVPFVNGKFIHAANVLLLLGYRVRDILWLRLFALASSLIAIPYFALQQTPMWAPIGWSALFAAINVFQSWRVIVERRPVKLTPEERAEAVIGYLMRERSVPAWRIVAPGAMGKIPYVEVKPW